MIHTKIVLGWMSQEYDVETANEVFDKLSEVQDFYCLMEMAPEEDAKAIKQLGDLVTKWEKRELTVDDIRAMNIQLSIGNIACIELKEK